MKIVSKFELAYILSKIFILCFFYLVIFIFFCFRPGGYVGCDTKELIVMILIDIVISVFYCVLSWKFLQIIVTEEDIIIKNLFTKKVRRINYDEIARLRRDRFANYGRPGFPDSPISRTEIKLKNGSIVSFDDYTYENFKEIYNCIQENLNKQ